MGASADASVPAQKPANDSGATLVDRCHDDLTCVMGDAHGPIADGTATLRRIGGTCFLTLHWDSDTFTHKLEAGGVVDDDGTWTSDTQRVVLTSGSLIEDCSR